MKQNSKTATGKKPQTLENKGREESKRLKSDVRFLLRKLNATTSSAAKQKATASGPVKFFIGIDMSDRKSRYCFLDGPGEIVVEGSLANTEKEFEAYFSEIPRSRIALEVGTHSPWASAVLERLGHEVYVANPRKLESIHKNKRKNDRIDAWQLARFARADVELLHPIRHRGLEARQDLVLLRARDVLVMVRTKLICSTRGLVKSMGGRLPKCSTASFHNLEVEAIPEGIREALLPMIEQIGSLTSKIGQYDRLISKMAEKKYPETELLKQPKGVGDVTSLAYVLTLEDPDVFKKSRDVGPYLGLVPKQYDSGESSPQLHITKTGDQMVRRLLVQSAHYMLGPFGEDSDLRRFGLKIAARGGKNAKKRAVIAMARKLSVLLHSLWRSGEAYEPLRQAAAQQQLTSVNG
jgi:transposase